MIVVDSSALIAILEKETDAVRYATAVRGADRLLISAVGALETGMVLRSRHGPVATARMWRFLQIENDFEIIPFDAIQVHEAIAAFDRYGKGLHRARLNLGDCAAYALAKTMNAPLLFKGGDFSQTDITAC